MADYGPHTEKRIAEVIEALDRYGSQSIVALEGVPGRVSRSSDRFRPAFHGAP